MTRAKLWNFDQVSIDLEDGDVAVRAVHGPSLTEVVVHFRDNKAQLKGEADTLKARLECLAADKIQNLASFLDKPE